MSTQPTQPNPSKQLFHLRRYAGGARTRVYHREKRSTKSRVSRGRVLYPAPPPVQSSSNPIQPPVQPNASPPPDPSPASPGTVSWESDSECEQSDQEIYFHALNLFDACRSHRYDWWVMPEFDARRLELSRRNYCHTRSIDGISTCNCSTKWKLPEGQNCDHIQFIIQFKLNPQSSSRAISGFEWEDDMGVDSVLVADAHERFFLSYVLSVIVSQYTWNRMWIGRFSGAEIGLMKRLR